MCTHLQRRGGRYFLRRRVPPDLFEHYGRREITKALGTSDRRTAAVLCRQLGLEIDDEFRLARAQQQPVQAMRQAIPPISSPTHQTVMEKLPSVSAPVASAVTLNGIVDLWEAERRPDTCPVAAARRSARRFTEMVGDVLPRDITRAHIVLFKDKMLESGQTGVNTNKQLTVFNTLLNFGVANGELEYSPAQGVKVQVKRNAKDARHPFALRNLQTIFDTFPAHTGEIIPNHIGRDTAYWIPLLALFYGARREELCQLRPEDIYEEVYIDETGADQKAWVLRITDAGEGQRGNPRLFSGLTPDTHGRNGSAFGKWFNTSLRTV